MFIVLLSIIVQILNWLNHKIIHQLIKNKYDNNNKEKSILHLKMILIKFSKVPKNLNLQIHFTCKSFFFHQ